MRTVITGTIHVMDIRDFTAIEQMMRDYSSCVRFAYQRICKDGLKAKNDIVIACKPIYMERLNQRYIQSWADGLTILQHPILSGL